MSTNIFTYGTLKKFQRNASLFDSEKYLGKAVSVEPKYMLYEIDDYAYLFPGLVRKEEGGFHVYGEAYEINDKLIPHLDHMEGVNTNPPLYKKDKILIRLYNGEELEVLVYSFDRDTSSYKSCPQCWPTKELKHYQFADKIIQTIEHLNKERYRLEYINNNKAISPEFEDLNELCDWAEKNTTIFGGEQVSAKYWRELMSQ